MHYDRRKVLQLGLAAGGLSLVASKVSARTATWSTSFSSPSPTARPWVRWWWPGGVVEDSELVREIDLLKRAGFGGAEIQAFNPGIPGLTPAERLKLHDYANPAFFEHLKATVQEAGKQGLQIDYTFGSAWPTGGGFAVTPELALVELTPAFTSITAPVTAPIKINLPTQTKKFGAMGTLDSRNKDPRAADWRARLEKRWKLVAVLAVQGNAPVLKGGKTFRESDVVTSGVVVPGPALVITDKVQDDGTLDWTPPSSGPWQIIAFKQFTVDSSVMAGVGEGPQLVVDHFNKAAFEAHAKRVGDPLDQMGAGKAALRAMFIDSLELMTDLYWSDRFVEEFKARRGYDLTPYLHYIVQTGWEAPWNSRYSPPYYTSDDTGDRVRADYRLTVSDLLIENFWQPFVDWSHRHGFKARLQANGGPSDVIKSFGLADIPETEDLGANGNKHFLRLPRAAADIYGKKIVSCESLCWIGKPYEITPAQWLAGANFLFASGVNEMIMHGFPYALHQDQWPGWFPFAPSAFLSGFSNQINEGNPLWAAIPTLTTYISHAQGLLQQGQNVVPVGVLITEMGYGSNAGDHEIEACLQDLLDHGYDYDRVSLDGLLKSRIEAGKLVTPGGIAFDVIVVPPLDGIRVETISRLLTLARDGLKIVFIDKTPSRAEGLTDKTATDKAVIQAIATLLSLGARIVPASQIASGVAQAGARPNVTFTSAPCLFVEKRLGAETLFLFHNSSDTPLTLACTIQANGHPIRLDPFTGIRTGITGKRRGERVDLDISIEAGAAAFVLFSSKALPTPEIKALVQEIPLTGVWQMAVSGHGRKGRTVEQTIENAALGDFSVRDDLADFSGKATYTTGQVIESLWLRTGQEVWLDLGVVHDMAKVQVNGKEAGTLISAPYRLNVSKHLRAGANLIEISTFNSPNNAMMDPKLPGRKDLKIKPAGLVGPVQLQLKA